jgi:two-component system response regulator NreC
MIVDDHQLVRAGLAALLERDVDIEVVGTAGGAPDALDLVVATRPDVAIVDYQMPGLNGVELCRMLHERHPAVAVILLTIFLDDDVVEGALKAHALAYLHKDVEVAELKRTIRCVARGESVLDPKVAGRVARWSQQRDMGQNRRLSAREVELLRLVATGATNRLIATKMAVSVNTARTYLRRAMQKLDCHSRAEAVAIAARQGIL